MPPILKTPEKDPSCALALFCIMTPSLPLPFFSCSSQMASSEYQPYTQSDPLTHSLEGPPARTLSRLQGPRADLDLAFEWLLDCKTNHASCRNAARYPPPSRLLHVRSNSEDSEPVVRLVETEMFDAPFAALSHRWGTRQPLRTTQSNYEKHLKEIPFDDLPKTFQDATLLVKRFGIKYLWIDSLCIIQDSVLDWESECPRMAGVYSNALFTIAAANASDSSKGFLGDFESSTRCDLGDSFMIRHIPNDTEWSLLDELLLDDEPCLLSNRGWVLQERLLSQRVLSFKAGRLQWQCNTHYRSDDILRPYQPAVGFSGATKKAIADHEDRASGYSYWQRIIENYSGCYLTHPQDKLPALSSLAFEFIKNEKDDYLAGLWKGDMPFSLCWKAQPEPKDKGQELPQSSISDYRAPSWSWASCNHRVSYDHLRRNSWNLDLEILYGDTVLHGLNQFGRVDGGELVVYARIATIQVGGCTLKTNKSGASTLIGDLDFDSPELALEHLQMDMSITVLLVLSCDYTLERGLLREISTKEHRTVNVSRMWRGLIVDNVENEEGEDVYRRIGLVDSMDCLREAWFDCESRVARLI